MQRVFVTGANRGIGLEFVRQYASRGDSVFAAARDVNGAHELQALCRQYADRMTLVTLDVADQTSVEAVAEVAEAHTDALDVLINNAGVYLRGDRPGTFDRDQFRQTFETNVIGAATVIQSLLPLLRAAKNAKILNMSSNMGSITNAGGGSYSYRISKTAVNMLSRLLANDLRAMGITVIAMNPGWVQTDMGGQGAPVSVEDSVRGMIRVLDNLTLAESGSFFEWSGRHNAW